VPQEAKAHHKTKTFNFSFFQPIPIDYIIQNFNKNALLFYTIYLPAEIMCFWLQQLYKKDCSLLEVAGKLQMALL